MPVQGAWDCGASWFNFFYGNCPLEPACQQPPVSNRLSATYA